MTTVAEAVERLKEMIADLEALPPDDVADFMAWKQIHTGEVAKWQVIVSKHNPDTARLAHEQVRSGRMSLALQRIGSMVTSLVPQSYSGDVEEVLMVRKLVEDYRQACETVERLNKQIDLMNETSV